MRVKFLSHWAGPRGSHDAGDEVVVSDPIGVSLVAANLARKIEAAHVAGDDGLPTGTGAPPPQGIISPVTVKGEAR